MAELKRIWVPFSRPKRERGKVTLYHYPARNEATDAAWREVDAHVAQGWSIASTYTCQGSYKDDPWEDSSGDPYVLVFTTGVTVILTRP